MKYLIKLTFLFTFWISTNALAAPLQIEITQGVSSAQPITIVPFANTGGAALAVDVAAIVAADLARSGRFKVLPRADLLNRPSSADQVNFKNWRVLGQDNLVIGQISEELNGQLAVQFQLFDVYKGEQLTGFKIPAFTKDLRAVAHRISDLIYEQLTGQKGAFSTRIAYVTSIANTSGNIKYKILVADADGFGPRTIVTSSEPLMSPAWTSKGDKISYVSYENGRSAIYTQTLSTGKREKLRSFKGINGAPAWSPDDSQMALTLSKDGNANIYIYNVLTGSFRRLTSSFAIDTEPNWSPDGRQILFTSGRGGKPQLYQVSVNGGRASRVTREGDYNARGRYAPDGKSIVMVHRVAGKYRIASLDLKTGISSVLTRGSLDESPTFAPNGSMILYSTKDGFKSILAAVSFDGKVKQKYSLLGGDVREPAWSPY